jgi:hypothetical protein
MTRDDIERMAKEAGAMEWGESVVPAMMDIEKFAALVAAAEREACAKVCEEHGDKWADGSDEWRNGQATASYYCAIAIRARGEQEQPR